MRVPGRRLLVTIATIAAWSLPSSVTRGQETPRVFTVDDVFDLTTIEEVQISPDGRQVLYVTMRRDLEENAQNTDVWRVAADGGEPLRLTVWPKADESPRWSPDGATIAFRSDRSGTSQIWLLPAFGGEPRQLTTVGDGVSAFAWSPEGTRLAFIAVEPRPEELAKEIEARRLPRIVDRDYRYAALWVVHVESGETEQVTRSPLHVRDFDWSPDGTQLAFSAAATPDLADSNTADIYVVPAAGGEPRRVAGFESADNDPKWSRDGRSIAFTSRGNVKTGAVNSRIYVVPATGGEPRSLTATFDESPAMVSWACEADGIYFTATQRTTRHLFVTPDRPLTTGAAVLQDFSIDTECRRIAFVRETGAEPPEVHVADLEQPDAARRLTDLNPQLRRIALGVQEVVRWTNADGQEVEGVLVKPVGVEEGQRYPLLAVIHGGPSGVDLDGFNLTRSAYPIQAFAGRGYAVLMVNYRGSSGYGEAWRQGNVGSLGAKEFDDIESGIDHLIARGLADPDRLGFMGWSYGGHMTYYAVTHSQRFKAASSGAGATNLISMYGQTDIPGFYSDTYFGFPPWEDFEFYVEHSSFFKVQNVTTPTLIQYGEKDARVPLPQGLEFYRALKERGVPSMLVIYPDQGHGVREPRYQKDLLQRNVEWFDRWIAGEPTSSAGAGR